MTHRDPGAAPAVAVLPGHGVGPEIMAATLRVLEAAGGRFDVKEIPFPTDPAKTGQAMEEAVDVARAAGALLKGPGAGGRSEALRRGLGLYCHVRRATALDPIVPTRAPGMDILVIRESEEDVYGGQEQRQTHDVAQCSKLATRPAAERFVRTAFAWARAAGRSKLTCVTKANVLRLTDGLFHDVFKEIAAENPDMVADHMIADAAAAKMVESPEKFDVIVAPNLYGDILGDLAAQLAGRPALTPSARLGVEAAVFEPVHGPASPLAGKLVANPTGLLLSGVKLLRFLGQDDAGMRVRDAWLKTLEDGVQTPDMHREGERSRRVSTRGFADAIIERLGEQPRRMGARELPSGDLPGGVLSGLPRRAATPERRRSGLEVVIADDRRDVSELAATLQDLAPEGLALSVILNRSEKVWPGSKNSPRLHTSQWRCRFAAGPEGMAKGAMAELLVRIAKADLDAVRIETLNDYDGRPGYRVETGAA